MHMRAETICMGILDPISHLQARPNLITIDPLIVDITRSDAMNFQLRPRALHDIVDLTTTPCMTEISLHFRCAYYRLKRVQIIHRIHKPCIMRAFVT